MKKLIILIVLFLISCIAVQAETLETIIDRAIAEAAKRTDQQLDVDKYLLEMERLNKAEIDGLFKNDQMMVERVRLRSEAIRKLIDRELAEQMTKW